MSPKKRRRLLFAAALVLAGAGVASLVLAALQENVLFFVSPSDLVRTPPKPGQRVRIGGLVAEGSLHLGDGLEAAFVVTDGAHDVTVRYAGALPDLFREGQGVVAMGAMGADGVFEAGEVLAKHDETYMPREVADALKRAGRWKEGEGLSPRRATP